MARTYQRYEFTTNWLMEQAYVKRVRNPEPPKKSKGA